MTDTDALPPPNEPIPGVWLIGGGQMGKMILAKDWSQTPLGPIESWPSSLRVTVNLILNSSFPICVSVGPQYTQIYNDAYRPLIADKHPGLLGESFNISWASVWPEISPAYIKAREGVTSFFENQRLFIDRRCIQEETFFTFSFSPIYDETGEIIGVLNPGTETTSNMLGQRRIRILRDVAARDGNVQTIDAALQHAAKTLSESQYDVPFALFYTVSDDGSTAKLTAQSGLMPGMTASPISVDLTTSTCGWPLATVVTTKTPVVLHNLPETFGSVICGPYPQPIQSALLHPLVLAGEDGVCGIMVVGVSTRLPLDDDYRSFFDLLASAITNVIANATAFAVERKRADALAEIDQAKTVFFSNVSHEFRTPLTLIIGPLEDELAEKIDALSPARRERLETAYRNSLRLLKLVNSLLDFARIEAGRMQAVYEPTDLSTLTAGLASNFRSACEQAKLQLLVDCPPLPTPVYVDRDMWEKIVLNLLSNAFKYTLAGSITVSLKAVGENVELSVRDTGVGIPADELPHVFERFYRVKGAPGRTHEGTGIGLALVKDLLNLHGGSISAESALGEGSVFKATLPIGNASLSTHQRRTTHRETLTSISPQAFVEDALRALPTPTSAPELVGQRPRIVWADDNADMRAYVLRLLCEDYDVEAVVDGEAALAAIRNNPPELVLSDVMMPKLDGIGLLRALRADDNLRTIPVILLSARAGEEARVEGLGIGADDYLIKPFSARELLARVGAQVELARLRRRAEREQVDEALRESERKFRQLAETMPQIVWIADASGQNTFFNQHWVEYTGLGMEESHGDGWITPFQPDDLDHAWIAWRDAAENGAIYSVECRLRRADGVYRWWLIRGEPIRDKHGNIVEWFGTCTDIDELKQAAAEVRKLNAELEQRVLDRTRQLEVANNELESFSYSVSHDLRAPLRSIDGFSRILMDDYADALNDTALTYLKRVCTAAQRMGTLIDDLLKLSRVSRQSIQTEPVDLSALVQNAAAESQAREPERRVTWRITPNIHVQGDLHLLQIAMDNLVGNAWKYTGKRSEADIEFGVKKQDGENVYFVRDNGVGFDMKNADKLFGAFQRLHSEKDFEGTGVGLATVARIILRHGGRIWAEAEQDKGATFLFTLPEN